MAKKINLYCPLHGTQLENERSIDKDKIETISKASCVNEEGRHAVFVTDRQAYEQEGTIEILLS